MNKQQDSSSIAIALATLLAEAFLLIQNLSLEILSRLPICDIFPVIRVKNGIIYLL